MLADDFDAVVVATAPSAHTRLLGLTLVERGRRAAVKVGARRVLVLADAADAGALARWRAEATPAALLIVRAGDQVVHPPLLTPLLDGTGDRRVAVGPDGDYAGALFARGPAVAEALDGLAAAADDRALAARWRAGDAVAIEHGPIARHAAATAEERRGAVRLLLQLIGKSEDGPVTRYLYRPVSRPLTRLFLLTPITPNQVSMLVAILGLIGCWLTARPGQGALIAGAALVLAGGFLDGCDGEIARLRLVSSKLGAWIDTIVDEVTTTAYLVAIGYHTYLHRPESWVVPSLVVGVACYVATIYAIYYFLIVVSKTGNSQHYLGDLEIVDDPTRGVGLRARPATTSRSPAWLRAILGVLAHVVRRDFINLGALALTLIDGYLVIYVVMLLGGVLAAAVIVPEHLRLRRQLRALARRGAPPLLLPS